MDEEDAYDGSFEAVRNNLVVIATRGFQSGDYLFLYYSCSRVY